MSLPSKLLKPIANNNDKNNGKTEKKKRKQLNLRSFSPQSFAFTSNCEITTEAKQFYRRLSRLLCVFRTLTLNQQWHQLSQILILMFNQGKCRTITKSVSLIMAIRNPLLDFSIGSFVREHFLKGSSFRNLIWESIS